MLRRPRARADRKATRPPYCPRPSCDVTAATAFPKTSGSNPVTTFQRLQRGTLPNYGQGKGEGGAGVRSREATRETQDTAHGTEGWRSTRSELRAGRRLAPRGGLGRRAPLAYLLPFLDPAAGADDDFVSSLEGHHFGHTVRRTRMVDVSASHHFREPFIVKQLQEARNGVFKL